MIGGATFAAAFVVVGLLFFMATVLAASWEDQRKLSQPGIPAAIGRAVAGPPLTSGDDVARMVVSQEATASFAFWALVTAMISVIVTTAGTIAIFRQIRFGQQALDQAKAANTHAIDTSRKQLRAYLNISYETPSTSGGRFFFIIHNSGQTPAIRIFYYIFIRYISLADGVVEQFDTNDSNWTNIAANHSHNAEVLLPKPNLTLSGEPAPRHDYIQIHIDCTYETIFSEQHVTSIAVNRRGWSEFWMDDEYTQFT